ncbi:hypothetical protein [Phenylobacterium sp.]|uniref:terminase small subunit-like protein n=1 Tax=Phenylobacterium sp. TaxID=1871053 RepID=UPI002FCB8017
MVVENARAQRARKRRTDSRYLELSEPFLERLAAGESVKSICSDPEMAAWSTVQRWLRLEPDFRDRFVAAREAGGGVRRGGWLSTYDPAICETICERLAEGEPLVRICAEPAMPSVGTVFNWLKAHAEFREIYALAREVQGHFMFDAVGQVIDDATPQTAYLAKVKIDGLRWQAGRLAPKAFGDLKERTPVEDGGKTFTVLLQSFDREGREVHTELTPEVRAQREARAAAFRERYAVEKAALLAEGRVGCDSLASERASAAVEAEWEA